MEHIHELSALFFSALIAATLIPAGSEIILVALVKSADINVTVLLLVATLGNVLGSVINWGLGWHILKLKNHKLFPFNEKQINKASDKYKKWGIWSLLLAWVPIIGDPLTLVAGIFRTKFLHFLILVTIGKAFRYIVIIILMSQN